MFDILTTELSEHSRRPFLYTTPSEKHTKKLFVIGIMLNALKLLLFLMFLGVPSPLSAYEAPEEKEDVFARMACPAFLMYDNAGYLADMTVELPCLCKSEEAYSVVWYYQKHLGSKDTRVLTDFEGRMVVDSAQVGHGTDLPSRFSIRLFSLLIFRAQVSDSGHYMCGTASGKFFYGYDVDVQEAHRVSFPWNLSPRPLPKGGMEGLLPLQVFTSYWPWSACDRCSVPGEQTRVGLCYLRSDYLNVRYRSAIPSVASCGSSAVPLSLRPQVGESGAKLAVRGCQTTCPQGPTQNPQKKTFMEWLGHGKAAAQVPVYYHNHPVGSHLILACPGAKAQHAVAWDRGKLPLYRTQYMEGLNKSMRVYIDVGHHLHFSPVQLGDTGSYYCWRQGIVAAEIRLGVYLSEGHRRQLSDPETIYTIRVFILCYMAFIIVFLLILVLRFSCQFLRGKVPKVLMTVKKATGNTNK